ncbi:MAG: hypothetical protein ACYC3I_02630 [Gemmataceae bacterium]
MLIGNLGLGSCLLAGCLRATLPPPGGQASRQSAPVGPVGVTTDRPATVTVEEVKQPVPSFDYLVSRTTAPPLDVQPAAALEISQEKRIETPVEPVEMRIQAEEPSSPAHPAAPPPPQMEVHPAPPSRPDAPPVQVLRGLLEHQSEEEINEHLKAYDPATRTAMLLLLTNIVQLEQGGGLARISPRDLAVWTDRLDTLTASLRGRAQLILERMCFCDSIKNFGEFAPLPSEHTFFQPGEFCHVYVEARNLSSRRQGDKFVTVLKARMEIFDENNRDTPPITWTSPPKIDVSAAPRQDYFINFLFQVPLKCPAGLYTMRIFVEDWTDAPDGAKQVSESRIAQRTLDFRVGGPIARPSRNRIAETAPSP